MATSQLVHQPHKPPLWVTLWFAISTPIVIWDALYIVLRPRSMKALGGDLSVIWAPYELYALIDPFVYGLAALERREGWPMAQSLMNLVECVANLWYLYQAHVQKDPASVLTAFCAVTATTAKTIAYFLIEAMRGFEGVKHNPPATLFWLYILPNGIWIAIPGLLVFLLGREIAAALRFAARDSKKRN